MSLPLLHAGRTNPGLSAALDLRFALDKSLTAYRGPTPSFSRASTGSYFDGSGVLRYQGYNLCQYSEDFTNAFWTKSLTSISSNVAIAPNGQQTADKIIETASTGFHSVTNTTFNLAASSTASIYLKAGERGFASIEIVDNFRAVINLSDGTVVSNTLASSTVATENVGNGWWRVKYTTNSSNIGRVIIYPLPTSTFGSYTGDGTSGIFAWGVQVETGATANQYSQTTNSANSGPRFDHTFNGTSWVSRGLLVEEQRTNLLLYSNPYAAALDRWGTTNGTLTANAVTSPDGTQNASSVVGNNGANPYQIYYYLNQSSGVYTQSFYLKQNGPPIIGAIDFVGNLPVAWFNLSNGTAQGGSSGGVNYSASISNVGNGWYRCSVTSLSSVQMSWLHLRPYTAMGGSTNVVGDGVSGFYVYGVQAEAGSFATSLISTNGSATTRSADVCQITGTDFSGFWNGTEGAIAYEADSFSNDVANQIVFQTSDGTANNRYLSSRSQNNAYTDVGFWVKTGNVWQALITTAAGAWNQNLLNKNAMAYKANDFAFSNSGAAVLTDTSGTLPTVDRMEIGQVSGTGHINGHIARLRYYNKRLPNATLQLLSEPDPTLNLQFALNKTLTPVAGPAPSFSRASTGSYFDSTGTLKYANVNLLTYSEQFDNAVWVKVDTTVSSNQIASPNGDLTAEKLIENSANAIHYTSFPAGLMSVSQSYTWSVYAKAGERNWFRLYIYNGTNALSAYFNLSNGSIGTIESGVTASIQNAGNGWYRCSVTRTVGSASSNGGITLALSDNNPVAYLGNGTSGIYIWGAQLEVGSSLTQYAKTEASTTAGPRFDHVYSGGQWVSRGLLVEEQRTNLATYSNTFSSWSRTSVNVTANSIVSPDGTQNASKLECASNDCNISKGITGGIPVVGSIYAKFGGNDNCRWMAIVPSSTANTRVWFDLKNGTVANSTGGSTGSIQDVGNGWYRCSAYYSSSHTTFFFHPSTRSASTFLDSQAGDFNYFYGAQIEQGAFATSYIDSGTSGSSTTRSADVCQITGTSFNWMWNQGEGSFVAEYDRLFPASSISNSSTVFQAFIDGSNNDRYALFHNSSGTVGERFNVTVGNVEYANLDSGVSVSQLIGRTSSAYKLNDFALTVNGGSIVSDTSGLVVSNADKLNIGRMYASNWLNGHIAKLIYYPARLTNTKLQQLST